MSNLNLSVFTSKILIGATFARVIYPSNGGTAFTPPAGFKPFSLNELSFTQLVSFAWFTRLSQGYMNTPPRVLARCWPLSAWQRRIQSVRVLWAVRKLAK